jgi:hypothetical protein
MVKTSQCGETCNPTGKQATPWSPTGEATGIQWSRVQSPDSKLITLDFGLLTLQTGLLFSFNIS